jgi:hypothetical protein
MITSFYFLLILFFLKTALIPTLSGTFADALSSVLADSRSLTGIFPGFFNFPVGFASALTPSGSRSLTLRSCSVAFWHEYHLALAFVFS